MIRHVYTYRRWMYHMLLLLVFGFSSQVLWATQAPVAKEGVLDLRSWDFDRQGPVSLVGSWEFYWHQLLRPTELRAFVQQHPRRFFDYPKYWNGQQSGPDTLTGNGWATYRLTVLVPDTAPSLMLRLPEFTSAAEFWINGRLEARNGQVGTSAQGSVPGYARHLVPVYPVDGRIELLICASNFDHRLGGPWLENTLGSAAQMAATDRRSHAVDFFLIGVFLIMAAYHLGLFFNRPDDKATLWFGLFSLFLSMRVLSTNELSINLYWPSITWYQIIRLEYVSLYALPGLFLLFLQSMYPELVLRRVAQIFLGTSAALLTLVLLTPPSVFSYTVNAFQVLLISTGLYVLVALARNRWRGDRSSSVVLIGFGALFATVVNDILYQNALISTANLVPIGFFIFIFSQAFLLSSRFAEAYRRSEDLGLELNMLNKTLEHRVNERTEQVQAQGEVLREMNLQLKYQTEALDETAGVLIADDRRQISYVNKQLCYTLGYTERQLLGQSTDLLRSPQHTDAFYQEQWQCIASEKQIWKGELCQQGAQGQQVWQLCTIVPFLDEHDRPYQFLSIYFDISERKQAEQAVRLQNQALEQQNERIERYNKEITNSIHYATRIQLAMFPKAAMFSQYFAEWFVVFRPFAAVSGDFYFLRPTQRYVYLIAADSTGHGVPGAFMSMLGLALAGELIGPEQTMSPNLLLDRMRQRLSDTLRETFQKRYTTDGMDLALCRFDFERMTLDFAGAMHPLLLFRQGQLFEYKADKQPIGISAKEKPFSNTCIELQHGDTLYLFSDGYRDQFGGEHRLKFGFGRFRQLLYQIQGLPLAEQQQRIEQAHEQWRGTLPQTDDLLLIGLRI